VDSDFKGGCRPYIQIFKHAQLLYSSVSQSGNVRHYAKDDGSIVFNCGIDLEGDILIRVRQMSDKDHRATMFRIVRDSTFYTISNRCRDFTQDSYQASFAVLRKIKLMVLKIQIGMIFSYDDFLILHE
jgi:hypothetical protein